MTEGQEQARLATVLCAPVVVWFVISAVMGLEIMGVLWLNFQADYYR